VDSSGNFVRLRWILEGSSSKEFLGTEKNNQKLQAYVLSEKVKPSPPLFSNSQIFLTSLPAHQPSETNEGSH
jgi:hypothetical protein